MKMKTLLLGAAAAFALAPAAQAERGSDGELKILYYQAVSTLNAYLSSGTKDVEAGSLVLEPLASFDQDGLLVPRLAAEIPTVENGGVSADLTSITWKLKDGVRWSDGSAVTSEDVKFTWEYCTHPDGGCAQGAKYEGIKTVETPDAQTVKVVFEAPKPYPYQPFTGATAPILQKAQFAACVGAAASSCTEQNSKPIGTGPYVVTDFKVNDVITLDANPDCGWKVSRLGPNFLPNPPREINHLATDCQTVCGSGKGPLGDAAAVFPSLSSAMIGRP